MADTPIKISRGLEANIPTEKIDGNIYFCTDTGNIYIDCIKENLIERVQISAAAAKEFLRSDGTSVSADEITSTIIRRWE